jgi:RNA polymerase sigma-70 factor, ECF subfamily
VGPRTRIPFGIKGFHPSTNLGWTLVAAAADLSSQLATDETRLRACVESHTCAVWRVLRRNGVPEADADDAVQRVFVVFSRRIDSISEGSELPFLLRTATFIASETRRTIRRRHEANESVPDIATGGAAPDEVCAHREAVEQLDGILDTMEESLRAVFVLYELEELTMARIAETLELAPGTVASRLRRARTRFEQLCKALRQREEVVG